MARQLPGLGALKSFEAAARLRSFSRAAEELGVTPAAVSYRVRDLEEQFPEFRKLLEERLAQYRADVEARVPLDFETEMLPAETRVHDKTEIAEEPESGKADEPFADERGLFRKRGRRIRRFTHVQQIDAMDCGAASLGMICRHFGRDVSLAHIRQLCHTSRDGTSLKALCHAATELGRQQISRRELSLVWNRLDEKPTAKNEGELK